MSSNVEQSSGKSEGDSIDITAWLIIPQAAIMFGMSFTTPSTAASVSIGAGLTLFLINDRLVKILKAIKKS